MSDRLSLNDTLRSATSHLRAIQKSIATNEHILEMNQIDALIGVALQQAQEQLRLHPGP